MLTKLTVSIYLLSFSFNASACGGSSSSLMEDLLIIISFGLILACVFMLPLSIVLFNSRYRAPHTACFIGYFACAVAVIVLMFYTSNELGLYLMIVLCLFCALPTIHTLILAIRQNNHAGKKEQLISCSVGLYCHGRDDAGGVFVFPAYSPHHYDADG